MEERDNLAYISMSQSITEGSWDRNLEAETIKELFLLVSLWFIHRFLFS